uniref:hypothetical protein n=1 Tax=Staphylococcus hominis TaxID=1290 RepID=UPI001643A993
EQTMLHSKNLTHYPTPFYQTMQPFHLPKYLIPHPHQLHLKPHHHKAQEIHQLSNPLIQILHHLLTLFQQQQITLNPF